MLHHFVLNTVLQLTAYIKCLISSLRVFCYLSYRVYGVAFIPFTLLVWQWQNVSKTFALAIFKDFLGDLPQPTRHGLGGLN